MAQLRSHLDLAEKAKDYAIFHFAEVMDEEEFLHLATEHLNIFLESPFLACDDDGQLLKGLLRWTNFDIEKRKSSLKSFLEKINLEDIVPQVLIEVIQHPVISGDILLESTVRDALTNVLSKKFDNVREDDGTEAQPSGLGPLRCFHSQDVRAFFRILFYSMGSS